LVEQLLDQAEVPRFSRRDAFWRKSRCAMSVLLYSFHSFFSAFRRTPMASQPKVESMA